MDVGSRAGLRPLRPKNPNFVLNQPRYQGAQVLLTRANFGCGSRANMRPGRCSISASRPSSPSRFADIFFNNCFKNGILPIVLPAPEIDALFRAGRSDAGLPADHRPAGPGSDPPDGKGIPFQIDAFRKECLLNGWDDIGLTLRHADKICAFEEKRRIEQPWLFA